MTSKQRTRKSKSPKRTKPIQVPLFDPDGVSPLSGAAEPAERNDDERARMQALVEGDGELEELAAVAESLVTASTYSDNTVANYSQFWSQFVRWAESMSLPSLPTSPSVVVLYIAHLSSTGKAPTTCTSYLAAVAWAHERAGFESPTNHPLVKSTREGMKRRHAQNPDAPPARRAHPLSLAEVRRMLEYLDQPDARLPKQVGRRAVGDPLRELTTARIRAFLLMAWFLGRRGAELIEADLSWLTRVADSDAVMFKSSSQKWKPDGFGNVMEPTSDPFVCPVNALQQWLLISAPYRNGVTRLFPAIKKTADGDVILEDAVVVNEHNWRNKHPLEPSASAMEMSDHDAKARQNGVRGVYYNFYRDITNWMKAAGVEPLSSDRCLSLHSTRRGLVTELRTAGVDVVNIARHVGWKKLEMVETYSDFVSTEHPLRALDL